MSTYHFVIVLDKGIEQFMNNLHLYFIFFLDTVSLGG